MCATVWLHLVKDMEVESYGSLPPGGYGLVTCGLTACTPGSAPGPTLGKSRLWENYLLLYL